MSKAKTKPSPTRATPDDLTPEQHARYEAIRTKAAADRDAGRMGPPVEALQVDPADGIPFAFALRGFLQQLKQAREAAGLTLADVADRSGIAAETLCRLENGAVRNPTYQTLAKYALAVGKSVTLRAD